jgi:hypothetical protein
MDFNKLMQTMRDLDQPSVESQVAEQPIIADECGDMGPMGGMPPSMGKPDTPPPSMSVNLNAQGLENIEQIMKLMTRVNPDMLTPKSPMPMPMPMPAMSIAPMMGPKPINKLIPDFDNDNNDMPGGEMDMDSDYNDDGKLDRHEKDHAGEKSLLKSLDRDGDDDHDMGDHEVEKDDEEEKEEAFGNSAMGDEGEDYQGLDAVIPTGNDIHSKGKEAPKVNGGGNPFARMEGTELRAAIKAELAQRLAEAKAK